MAGPIGPPLKATQFLVVSVATISKACQAFALSRRERLAFTASGAFRLFLITSPSWIHPVLTRRRTSVV